MSIINRLFDTSYPGLAKAMDLGWRRGQAISSNIANADTPQYRAMDVDFAGELERAFGQETSDLKLTNEKHLDLTGSGDAHLVQDLSGATKADGNNVDLDIQMARLASNGGKYSAASTLLRKKLGMLKMAVRSGN